MTVIRIVDVAYDMPRIITATVIVGIIIVDVARADGQMYPWRAAAAFVLEYVAPGALAGL